MTGPVPVIIRRTLGVMRSIWRSVARLVRGAMGTRRGRTRPQSDGGGKLKRLWQSAGGGVPDYENTDKCQGDQANHRARKRAHAVTANRGLISTKGRSFSPKAEPTKAAANHAQPCKLPLEMPEKNAPTLQPSAMRLE